MTSPTHIAVVNRSKRDFVLTGKTIVPGANNVPRDVWEREAPMLHAFIARGELVPDESAPIRAEGQEVPADLSGLRAPEALKLIESITDEDALLAYTDDKRVSVRDAATRRLEELGKV